MNHLTSAYKGIDHLAKPCGCPVQRTGWVALADPHRPHSRPSSNVHDGPAHSLRPAGHQRCCALCGPAAGVAGSAGALEAAGGGADAGGTGGSSCMPLRNSFMLEPNPRMISGRRRPKISRAMIRMIKRCHGAISRMAKTSCGCSGDMAETLGSRPFLAIGTRQIRGPSSDSPLVSGSHLPTVARPWMHRHRPGR